MVCAPFPREEPCVNIFVGNLAFTTTEQDLRQLFEPYGTVETVRIMADRETGPPAALTSSRCRTAGRQKAPLTPSTARPWPAVPSRSMKHDRGNRAGSRANHAGKPPDAVS
jgi:cold-inducible RNA-binding protein